MRTLRNVGIVLLTIAIVIDPWRALLLGALLLILVVAFATWRQWAM